MSRSANAASVAGALAKNRIGMLDIAGFVVGAAAPLTVIAGVITTAYAVTGIRGIPLAVLVVAAILAVFSVGFSAMSRRISNAGAFSAYISQGLGRPPGVGAAAVATLAYNGLQVGAYGAFGVFSSAFLEQKLGYPLPWFVYALGAWALVLVIGVLHVEFSAKVLLFLLGLEVLVALVFNAANFAHPTGGVIRFDSFNPANLVVEGFGAAMIIAFTVFIGFESGTIFSEEARDSQRTVPYATYFCLALIAALVSTSAWGMSVAIGTDEITAVTGQNQIETIFILARGFLGDTAADIGSLLFISSLFAAMLSFHTASNRYLFALGRERVLPHALGRTNRYMAPYWASLTQSAIGLGFIVVYAVAGLDPIEKLFFWGGTIGAYGVMILLAMTSVAVLSYFRNGSYFWDGVAVSPWVAKIAPGLAAALLTLVLGTATVNFRVLLNLPPGTDSPLTWIFPAVYVALFVFGVLRALWMRRTNFSHYAGIGLGAHSSSGRADALTGVAIRHGRR